MKKIKRIEEYLEQSKFNLDMDKKYMNKTNEELRYQEGIIRGLEIALQIFND